MTASKITSAISTLLDSKIPLFLWGPPGIGKSSLVNQLAQNKKMEFIKLRLSLMDSSELKGIPLCLPKEGEGILFLDELNASPPAVQSLAYQLVLDRKTGEYKLPDGWSVVAAGSAEIDTRFTNDFVHLEMDVDINDWKKWAFNAGLDERVIAYIGFKNEDLFSFDASSQEKSLATPRSWELVSDILKLGMDENLLSNVIAGTIGKEIAISFLSFTKAAEKLPDIESILQRGEADCPSEIDVLYTLSSILVSFLLKYKDEENLENVLKYTLDLEPEFAVMIVQDLQRLGLKMEHLPTFLTWIRKFADLRAKSCQR